MSWDERHGGDHRGGASARRARKSWMLRAFGNGTTVGCWLRGPRCLEILTFATIEADRITPGAFGGSYRRQNLQPACGPCNKTKHYHPELLPPPLPIPMNLAYR